MNMTDVWMITPKNIAGFYTQSDLPIIISTNETIKEAIKKIMEENKTTVVEIRQVSLASEQRGVFIPGVFSIP